MSYEYLDRRDLDGYGSLFEVPAESRSAEVDASHVRAESGSYRVGGGDGGCSHVLEQVFCCSGRVVVVGRVVRGERNVEFVDLFTLTEHGLLRSRKSYFFVEPGAVGI
ncbi:hypothetical protein ACFFSW_00260 [Saccharothrix longispora]|uniref:SnoaL-like protein n=1 Tax=Saccharothrix longispora TaxID=33920 RepID=A0ABU1PUU5_9PSEU|nr:hypothetical protein [Saccharothrix longispora]MDR6594415.1 hypothetical protein [Saccharothrix longispora]